jgi:hypothetical protein
MFFARRNGALAQPNTGDLWAKKHNEGTEKGFRWMNNKEKNHKLDGAYTKYVTKVYVFLTQLVAA